MILLTGFGPFGNITKNLSCEITRKIASEINNYNIIKRILPVSWKKSKEYYRHTIEMLSSQLELVFLLGIHSESRINIEKYGWNVVFGKDVERKVKFGFIRWRFPLYKKTILDVNELYFNLKDKTNVSISYFAGTYMCNYIYYWALIFAKNKYPVVFIHIPQNLEFSICLKKIEEIIRVVIKMYFKKN
ncbi:MAG: hypothetical protein ACFFB0_11385 [Promethearchaeota archaeon]